MTNEQLKPVVLSPTKELLAAISIVGGILCALILIASQFLPEVHPLYCLLVLIAFLPPTLIILLTEAFNPAKVIISLEGIRLHVRRTKTVIDLPWSDYNHLYILEGYRRRAYLFTPEPLNKDEQLFCYKACLKNKDIPFTFNHCMVLDHFSVTSGNVDLYLPKHIQKMTWKFCAKI